MSDFFNQLLRGLVAEALPHLVNEARQALAGNNTPAPAPAPAAFVPAAPPAPAPVGGMFGAPAPAAPVAPSVTPDMIQSLIMPLVQNEQVKAALTAQMQAMGINNLPDATPAQLPELYARFQEVERQAKAAGLIGAPAAAAAAPALI